MICASLVIIQTHRQHFDQLIWIAHPVELEILSMHTGRMSERANRPRLLVFVIMDENNKAEQPQGELVDIIDWCRASLQELSHSAQNRCRWHQIIKEVLCPGYMWNKTISAFVDVRLKQFYFSAWKVVWNYLRIISQAYCSSRIFSNMFIVAEIIFCFSFRCGY